VRGHVRVNFGEIGFVGKFDDEHGRSACMNDTASVKGEEKDAAVHKHDHIFTLNRGWQNSALGKSCISLRPCPAYRRLLSSFTIPREMSWFGQPRFA
jgi:hypothetical protein